jgi:hypothetical protein
LEHHQQSLYQKNRACLRIPVKHACQARRGQARQDTASSIVTFYNPPGSRRARAGQIGAAARRQAGRFSARRQHGSHSLVSEEGRQAQLFDHRRALAPVRLACAWCQ